MADWSALVSGFQQGRAAAQDYRARKQLERFNEQALEGNEMALRSRRDMAKIDNPEVASVLGKGYALRDYVPYEPVLEDPYAVRIGSWIKNKIKSLFSNKKKDGERKALDLGGESGFESSNPGLTGEEEEYTPAQTYPYEGYADGGEVAAAMENARGQTQAFASQASAIPQTTVQASGPHPVPSITGVIDTGQGYADGGKVSEEEEIRRRAAQARARNPAFVERATEAVRGADRTAVSGGVRKALDVAGKTLDKAGKTLDKADDAVGKFTGRAAEDAGFLRRAASGAKRVGALGALAGTGITTATTPTEVYRKRFGLETNDPSLPGDIGVRTLGALSELGSILTFGVADRFYRDKQRQAAETGRGAPVKQALPDEGPLFAAAAAGDAGGGGQRMALDTTVFHARPLQRQAVSTDPEIVNFGDINIDAKEVPDMKTDDWKRYRAEMIAAAQKSGDPSAVSRVNDMVTEMQMKGFLNYGQQGLALQLAGNVRGAMAAYRAAFQYFPNGYDVEFGTVKDPRTGRMQIVGFSKDEKTGEIVPGTELIITPERVAVLLENFRNPQAYRLWTEDWRDFAEELRRYEEITKPLAQAQADSLANTSAARLLAAENQALRAGAPGGAGMATNLRNAERVFRERLSMMALEDEAQADYLASVMSQIKMANPDIPDNTIMQVVMAAARDGTLEWRLAQMGIGRPRQ